MAYNRLNYLRRVIEIQNITLKHKRLGLYQKEIYHKFIENVYYIHMRTYENYLYINAKKQLKDLEQKQTLKT